VVEVHSSAILSDVTASSKCCGRCSAKSAFLRYFALPVRKSLGQSQLAFGCETLAGATSERFQSDGDQSEVKMFLRSWRFLTLLLTALTLGMSLSHMLELQPKMQYDGQLYITIQNTLYQYFGLPVGGVIEIGAVVTASVLVYLVRTREPSFYLTLAGAICLLLSLVVYFSLTEPVNFVLERASPAAVPSDWMQLRSRWEYSHVARFALCLVGFSSFIFSMLKEIPVSKPEVYPGRSRTRKRKGSQEDGDGYYVIKNEESDMFLHKTRSHSARLADEVALRALYQQITDGWNLGSGKAFAVAYTEDADYVGFDGTHLEGREEIAMSHQQLFDSFAKGSRLAGKIANVRFLTPEVAIVNAVGGVVMAWQSDFEPEETYTQTMVAMKRNGSWRITLFQNTRAQYMNEAKTLETATEKLRLKF